MTRIVVDRDLCQGHGVCEGEAPEVFSVSKQGELTVLEDPDLFHVPKHGTVQIERPEVTPDNEAAVLAAIRHCPTQALSLKES